MLSKNKIKFIHSLELKKNRRRFGGIGKMPRKSTVLLRIIARICTNCKNRNFLKIDA